MFKLVWVLVYLNVVYGGFFDLTDVDDPLALLWNIQPLKDKITQCYIDENTIGVCMDKGKCMASGGIPSKKKCGPFFTCCAFGTNCHQTSNKKVSYFKSSQLNKAITNCQYTIKLKNPNVCQIRLDFEELLLAPAILLPQTTAVNNNEEVFKCAKDSLAITPNHYGVPVLCGNNTKQHLYVHVNQSSDALVGVTIDITLADRLNSINQYLPQPKWKIKFTQLECPMKRHKFDLAQYAEVENINNDFYSLAPQGAIQYFTEWKGEVKSFGFNSTSPKDSSEVTSYPSGIHYTIAFKRPTNVCGIKFTPVTINLQYTSVGSGNTETITCVDYLYVPEYYSSNSYSEEVCASMDPFYSLVPGPFFINFKALGTYQYKTETQNYGFHLHYELSGSNGCSELIND